jgi:hypothetical protein
MLSGTADPERLARGAPSIASFEHEGLTLPGAEQLILLTEIASATVLGLLPPALHPTNPPLVRLVVTRCPDSPVGAFCMAELRLECRSGVRPRGFLLGGFIDSPAAGALLAERWGYRLHAGEVTLEGGYSDARARVSAAGTCVLDMRARDLVPLGPGDVQFVATLHLAGTPRGTRLVQVDAEEVVRGARRGAPGVELLACGAFGAPTMRVSHPVSAVHVALDLTLPPVRFVCRPDVLAFVGTERV